mgnify:CR=1 FL=1
MVNTLHSRVHFLSLVIKPIVFAVPVKLPKVQKLLDLGNIILIMLSFQSFVMIKKFIMVNHCLGFNI